MCLYYCANFVIESMICLMVIVIKQHENKSSGDKGYFIKFVILEKSILSMKLALENVISN